MDHGLATKTPGLHHVGSAPVPTRCLLEFVREYWLVKHRSLAQTECVPEKITAYPEMWIRSSRFWVKLIRVVNLMAALYGIGMIVYCLWLLKTWNEETTELPFSPFLARPLFIHTCLAIGIALCLGTIYGYIATNCFSNHILCTYIVSICCLLLLEVAAIVIIYFRTNWLVKINKYIDEHHSEFKSFVLFHLKMCRIILIISLVPQVSSITLAIILRVVGMGTASGNHLDVPDFTQSFLVVPDSLVPENSKD